MKVFLVGIAAALKDGRSHLSLSLISAETEVLAVANATHAGLRNLLGEIEGMLHAHAHEIPPAELKKLSDLVAPAEPTKAA